MTKATIICTMDVSGSMGSTKRELAKKYFYLYRALLESQYDVVDTKFIGHTTIAFECENFYDLFKRNQAGGTYLSSGTSLALNKIKELTVPYEQDVYTLIFSDGDNWREDNEIFVQTVKQLCRVNASVQYIELKISNYQSSICSLLNEKIKCKNFNLYHIKQTSQIFSTIQKEYDNTIGLNSLIKNRDIERTRNSKNGVVSIVREGRKTMVELLDGTKATVICHKDDVYDDEISYRLAKIKAEIKSKEKLYKEVLELVIEK